MSVTISVTEEPPFFDKLIADSAFDLIILVQYCIISSIVNFIGIITNFLNIVVFIKQGFNEAINISLLGLAISDLCSLITLQWLNFCLSPVMLTADLPFSAFDVQYLSAGWPRTAFTRITAWITAFITLERCICITLPLKVKMIITHRRTFLTVVLIFILLIGSVMPTYYTSRLVWKFSPTRNRTLLGLAFTGDRERVDSYMFALNNTFIPLLALVTTSVCTAILAAKLHSKSKWRAESATNAGDISKKDKKIVKLVSAISGIFLVCFLPNAVNFAAMASVPGFNIDGKYRNLMMLSFSFSFILESVNSSINMFLYINMSSKFRETFNHLFRCYGELQKQSK